MKKIGCWCLWEIWNELLMTCGPGSFMQELIELAGGRTLAADAPGAWLSTAVSWRWKVIPM